MKRMSKTARLSRSPKYIGAISHLPPKRTRSRRFSMGEKRLFEGFEVMGQKYLIWVP